ncbi:Probable calcium-binding protein CML16 [Linum perenne]
MNSDGNKSTEFDELVAAISNDIDEQTLTNQDHMLEIFQSCSFGDGNDVITKAELAVAMGQPPTYKELSEMMIEADQLTMRWICRRWMGWSLVSDVKLLASGSGRVKHNKIWGGGGEEG